MKLTDRDPERHHSIAYPMEVSAPKFDLVPVTKQKDIMLNAALMNAEQEYDRIMELVQVLEKQARDIHKRIETTKMVCEAEYDFQPYQGQTYWLVRDIKKNSTILVRHGPDEWTTGAPDYYEYTTQVLYLGDHTWREVGE